MITSDSPDVKLGEAVAYIRAHSDTEPQVGVVLGSGLNSLAESVTSPDVIDYQSIPHFPRSTVEGHEGRLILGRLGHLPVLMMQGRVHFYEGYSMAEVTFAIRVMQALGIKTLLVTNAAGGIDPTLVPGDLMVIRDHIFLPGLAGHNPLHGPNDDQLGPRFPDMSRAYDPDLIALAHVEAGRLGIQLHEGVYAMVAGPSFETPAEIRFLRAMGADAVGMSTAPEVIVANHAGMRVLGVSLISNATIDSYDVHEQASHAQVLEAGRRAVPSLAALFERVLQRLA